MLSDARLYGTLCCVRHEPDPWLRERYLGVTERTARWLVEQPEHHQSLRSGTDGASVDEANRRKGASVGPSELPTALGMDSPTSGVGMLAEKILAASTRPLYDLTRSQHDVRP